MGFLKQRCSQNVMEDEKSCFFSKKKLALFAEVWVKTHFALEIPFIDLIYKLLFNPFAEVSTLWVYNFIQYYLKKDFHQKFSFNGFTVFVVDAPLKSNSPYFFLSKNRNFSKSNFMYISWHPTHCNKSTTWTPTTYDIVPSLSWLEKHLIFYLSCF